MDAAGLVELRHAVLFDLLLAGDPQLLLHLVLDGKAVAVPAEPAVHLAALHGLVAGNDVLDRAGDEMPVVRQAGGERGAVVEDELLRALAAAEMDFSKIVVLLPESEHLLFHLREARLRVHGPVQGILLATIYGEKQRRVKASSGARALDALHAPPGLLKYPTRYEEIPGTVARHRRGGARELAAGIRRAGRRRRRARRGDPAAARDGRHRLPHVPVRAGACRKAPPLIAAEVARRVPPASRCRRGPRARGRCGRAVRERPAGARRRHRRHPRGDRARRARPTAEARSMAGSGSCWSSPVPTRTSPCTSATCATTRIGESLSRILAAAGATLRKVNLINDRGVHICKSMLAYQMFGGTRHARERGRQGRPFRWRLLREVRPVREGPPGGGGAGAASCCASGRKGTPRSWRSGRR